MWPAIYPPKVVFALLTEADLGTSLCYLLQDESDHFIVSLVLGQLR